MFGLFSCRHKWNTVAIDERFGWKSNSGSNSGMHIVRYTECAKCGERGIEYDDPEDHSRKYAREGHSDVASARVAWIHGGYIEPHSKALLWVDKTRAPLQGFESWLKALKSDPSMKDLLSQSMVDDALGQLEVAVKLHINNLPAPKVTP